MKSTANTVRILQAVAMIVGIAVFLWSTGLPTLFRFAEAASITFASDTLSVSAPGVVSNHTIAFTSPNGMLAGETIEITFPAQFNVTGVDFDDIDISASGTDKTVAAANGAATWGASFGGNVLTLTSPSDVPQASATPFVIKIGNHAAGGNNQIVNPSATTSYAIDIGGTMPDSGQVRVAIIEEVTVSASVDTSLSFTITGVGASSTVNGSPTTTSGTTTNLSLPFGTLGINVSKVLAQDLTITTNATHGYSVTVEQSGALQSTTGATIDGFIDGADTASPAAWQAPGALLANPATYGHWGITSNDATTSRLAPDEFGVDEWIAGTTSPRVIMGHTGPSDGTEQGSGYARIGYQIQISALQEAGDDYTTTLRYIATPVF